MALHFSRTTNGFYDDALKYASLPSDLVAITGEQHTALLDAQSQGKTITSDANGNPIAVAPGLAAAQTVKLRDLSAACRAAITGGFTSSALNSTHTYGSQASDQQNLTDALMSGTASPLWCASGSTWSFVSHTEEQIQQVHADWMTFRVSEQNKLISLTAQVNAAGTVTAVQAIAW